MGRWLDRLKNQSAPIPDPTKPTKGGFVGFVGCLPRVPLKTKQGDAIDWELEEIETYQKRIGLFCGKGIKVDEAERIAERLLERDRDGDDRRLCLECRGLRGGGSWRCGNWMKAGVPSDGLAYDLVMLLQRCAGFTS